MVGWCVGQWLEHSTDAGQHQLQQLTHREMLCSRVPVSRCCGDIVVRAWPPSAPTAARDLLVAGARCPNVMELSGA